MMFGVMPRRSSLRNYGRRWQKVYLMLEILNFGESCSVILEQVS